MLGFAGHAYENRKQFVGFFVQVLYRFSFNGTVFHQEFDPELGLVRLLQRTINLGTELRIRSRPRSLSACEIIPAANLEVALAIRGLQIFLAPKRILLIQAGLVINQF